MPPAFYGYFNFTPSINTVYEKELNIGQEVSDQRPNKLFFTCFTKLEYIISLIVGSNDIVKIVQEILR